MNTDQEIMETSAITISDEQDLTILHNALLVAGHQMGDTGDHWPVIKSTIASILKDWEIVRAKNQATENYRLQFRGLIQEMEIELAGCRAEDRAAIENAVIKMRELYEARFTPVSPEDVLTFGDQVPMHIKRAENLIKMLEETDE